MFMYVRVIPQSLIWCPSCSPIVNPSSPTMAARKAIFGWFNRRKWARTYTRHGTESPENSGPASLKAQIQTVIQIKKENSNIIFRQSLKVEWLLLTTNLFTKHTVQVEIYINIELGLC